MYDILRELNCTREDLKPVENILLCLGGTVKINSPLFFPPQKHSIIANHYKKYGRRFCRAMSEETWDMLKQSKENITEWLSRTFNMRPIEVGDYCLLFVRYATLLL